MRWPWTILTVLLLVPSWTGEPRGARLQGNAAIVATRFVPDGGWPRRVGALAPVGAVTLASEDPAFGGFSALALWRGRAILLSDGGNIVRFRIAGSALHTLPGTTLRDGPGTGWTKESRDAESMVLDPATGRAWVGFERANAIWRYAPGFIHAEAWRQPAAMRAWGRNTGPESLVRLVDGRFLTLREGWIKEVGPRAALLFDGDPVARRTRGASLRYRPPDGFAPSDAALLPGGDVLVLNRRWRFPMTFDAALVRIAAGDIRPGALLQGRVIARLGREIDHENAEGIAITRERGRTMVWLVTDNDGSHRRQTILAKFRLLD